MLGVPPAFVLSQDQTLYEVCISKSFDPKYLFNPDSLRLLAITSFLFKTQFRFYSDWNLQGFCINSIVQFSRYHFRHSQTFVISNFYIISYPNQFVKYFLKFFEKLFLNIFCRFSATLILYHIFLKLSSIFLKKFLISSFRCVLLLNSRLTATLILYHTFFCLSSSFFQKTFKFFLLPKYVYSLHLLHFSSPSSESFIIISWLLPFVNSFWEIWRFLQFFEILLAVYGHF